MTKLAHKLSEIKHYLNAKFHKERIFAIQNRLIQTNLFHNLDKKELQQLATHVKWVSYKKGDVILKKNDLIQNIFIIESGLVKADSISNQENSFFMQPNDYFGENLLIKNKPYVSEKQYKAITEVTLLDISIQSIDMLSNENIAFKKSINLIRKKELIKKILLSSLKTESNSYIRKKVDGDICHFKKDDVIFNQGDEANHVYFIVDGNIDLILKNKLNYTLKIKLRKNQIFGELGIINNKPRSGTAIVNSDKATILVIQKNKFFDAYHSDNKFKNRISAIKRIYKIAENATIAIQTKILLGFSIIKATIKLQSRTIQSIQVIDKNIFHMYTKNIYSSKTIHYEYKNTILRELVISGDKIVGVINFGQWNEINYICQLILNQTPIELWKLRLFTQTGCLNMDKEPQYNNKFLCHCMQITRQQISKLIREGVDNIDELMTMTGAGSVCGGCRPDMLSLLGKNAWSMVEVIDVKELSQDIRCYRLKPYDNKIFSYQPGQHIVFSCLVDQKWIERSYTLISVSKIHNYYEIIINRIKDGYFSHWIFNQSMQNIISRLSIPLGNFIINLNENRPLVFFAAGIGITPALAFIRTLFKSSQSNRDFYLHYSVKSRDKVIYYDELMNFKNENNNGFNFDLIFTEEEGHIKKEKIGEIINQFPQADFYICGPKSYQIDLSLALHHLNVSSNRIKIEDFTPVKNINE